MPKSSAAGPSKWSDLGQRSLSAIVLVVITGAAVWVGGFWFVLLVAVVGVAMAHEWTAIVHGGDQPQFALHAAAAITGALLPAGPGLWPALLVIAVLWALSAVLAQGQVNGRSVWRLAGVPYVGLPGVALTLLRDDPGFGFAAIVWILVIVGAADVLAYFAGRLIGGPRLAPVLSPKKTWAGLAGAVVGSVVGSLVVMTGYGGSLFPLAVVSGLLALVEQGGDIFESAMKRHFGVKDSGRLIPGHGGIMDRIDGLVAVATLAAAIGLIRGGESAVGAGLLQW
jgi:phosphatidate cytidylyltransferase